MYALLNQHGDLVSLTKPEDFEFLQDQLEGREDLRIVWVGNLEQLYGAMYS